MNKQKFETAEEYTDAIKKLCEDIYSPHVYEMLKHALPVFKLDLTRLDAVYKELCVIKEKLNKKRGGVLLQKVSALCY